MSLAKAHCCFCPRTHARSPFLLIHSDPTVSESRKCIITVILMNTDANPFTSFNKTEREKEGGFLEVVQEGEEASCRRGGGKRGKEGNHVFEQ